MNLSNVVIIKCVISVDVLPNPFFEHGFENIRCLCFFYIFWYCIVQFWTNTRETCTPLANLQDATDVRYTQLPSSGVWYRVSLLPKEEEGDGNSLFCFCHAIICALLSLFLHSSFRQFIKGYCHLTKVFLYFNVNKKQC